jgi:DUF1680 family protein
MFLLHGDARCLDVLERVIYNGFLSGVSLDGDRFFYVNPLSFDGEMKFNRNTQERQPWFATSCCPSNVVRFLPSLPGYVYAHRGDELFVNLFIGSRATIPLTAGKVHLRQLTGYPWDGQIRIEVEAERAADFTLSIRMPGWAQGRPVPSDLYRYQNPAALEPSLRVNGQPVSAQAEQGFVRLRRAWQPGDVVELELPMPVRRVLSHPQVQSNLGCVALERGPLVYCAEWADNGPRVLATVLPDQAPITAEHRPDLLGGVAILRADLDRRPLTAIPYYAWGHRGIGEMAVWFKRGE